MRLVTAQTNKSIEFSKPQLLILLINIAHNFCHLNKHVVKYQALITNLIIYIKL